MPSLPTKLIILDTVDSTNNYAMGLIKTGGLSGKNAVFARNQTAGKGQRGKQWNANPGENIILSVITEMQWLPISRQFELSVAVALGCLDLASKYINSGVKVKWPNDLFINDSKTGGVLIENVIKGTLWQWAVIGIGINVNQLKFEDFNISATSLQQNSFLHYDVLKLAEELHTTILERIEQVRMGKFAALLEEYNEKLYAKDRLVKLGKGNIVFNTTIKRVSGSGQLITSDVIERQFNFDEVSFRGIVDD